MGFSQLELLERCSWNEPYEKLEIAALQCSEKVYVRSWKDLYVKLPVRDKVVMHTEYGIFQ